jgi:signal transduction histidine kinase
MAHEKVSILLVDDSPSKLLAMSAALSELNENVVTALSGREALRQMLHQEFAVILLDVNMPDIDGFETASLIRARESSAHVPIIFITAYGDDTSAFQGYSLGAVDYLMTPVVPAVLRAKITVFAELYRKNRQIQAQADERIALEREQVARRTAEAANRMKDEFLATLSHELRTPLNSILGWAQLLKMGKHTPEDLETGLDVIERNSKLQAKIIEDLLDVSRIISGKLQLELRPASVVESVSAALDTALPNIEAKQIQLVREFATDLPLVNTDTTRLQQIVGNLVSNAVKFTPGGGEIRVVVAPCELGVEISVSDTGEGITQEFLPYVFDRFRQADASTTRSQGGLGIGLAIVRQLVEMHGGRVDVESSGRGEGSRFYLTLPAAEAAVDSAAEVPAVPAIVASVDGHPCLAGVRMLVVDDQQDARNLVKRLLQDCHAEVVDAPNATIALRICQEFRPQVLVSDIGMPDVDGFELIRRLRRMTEGADILAIALTAYARPEERNQALEAGYQVHLAKPVNAAELTAAVATLLGRQGINSRAAQRC